jgi:hypothetical protein
MTGHTPPQSLKEEDEFERTAELPVLDINAMETVPAWARARLDEAAGAQRGERSADGTQGLGPAPAGELARQLEERRRVEQGLRDELDGLRPLAAALTQAETQIQQLLAMAGKHSASLTEAEAEIARLRKDAAGLEALRHRCAMLEAELAVARRQMPGADGETGPQAALQEQLAAREVELQRHKESAAASTLWQRELLCQMRVVEESLRHREAELAGRLAELAQARASEDQLFTVAQQAQAAERGVREQLAQRELLIQEIRRELQSLREEAESPGEAPAWRIPAGVTRLLVRTDSDAEVAHVLGERTSIGRGADNDLQLDVTSISRHHALILAGAAQTIIEDLRSTNGVRVNGRRIKRQSLRDGDTVLLGKAQFRFVLRAVVEAE